MGFTRVFYNESDKLTDVKQIVDRREPVNIAGDQRYYKDLMLEYFGYTKGAYTANSPNVAVYTHTPVKDAKQGRFLGQPVHIINLIGLAFDTVFQPDFQKYMHRPKVNGRYGKFVVDVHGVRNFYMKMWRLAFEATRALKLDTLVTFDVGAGAFNPFPDVHDFINKIQEPVLEPLRRQYPDIKVIDGSYNKLMIPGALSSAGFDLSKTLWVNAWDPWSMLGNGNGEDNSLDGFWGRSTAIAVLGWPRTNPEMTDDKYIAV